MKHVMMILAWVMLSCTASLARNSWYETPKDFAVGAHVLDTVPANTTDVMIHLRLSGINDAAAQWTMNWAWKDSANYVTAIVNLPDRKFHDNLYPSAASIEVIEVTDGAEELLVSSTINLDDTFFSLKLLYDGFSARLYGGCAQKIFIGEVPFDVDTATEVQLVASQPVQARRITVICNQGFSSPQSEYGSMQQLQQELQKSKHPIVGYWKYLDRDVDAKKATLGEKYDLWIVADDNDCFQIISESKQATNTKLNVKGWLTPTKFQNNYDLIWYDANGHELNDDNNAQLSDDGSILTLRFPVYKSQLRFTKH